MLPGPNAQLSCTEQAQASVITHVPTHSPARLESTRLKDRCLTPGSVSPLEPTSVQLHSPSYLHSTLSPLASEFVPATGTTTTDFSPAPLTADPGARVPPSNRDRAVRCSSPGSTGNPHGIILESSPLQRSGYWNGANRGGNQVPGRPPARKPLPPGPLDGQPVNDFITPSWKASARRGLHHDRHEREELLLHNPYDVLAREEPPAETERDVTQKPPLRAEWLKHPAQRAVVSSIIDQMKTCHLQPRPPVALDDLDQLDDAESVKTAIMQFAPADKAFNTVTLSKAAALWNRVALQRLRFRGQRHYYMVVHTLDLQHRLLVLQAPPTTLSETELEQHARTQMT